MSALRNNGARYSADGLGDELIDWPAGVVREVTAEQAAYLLGVHSRFSVVSVVKVATPESPKVPDMTSARQVVQDLQLGKHDAVLSAIASKESERSKPRRSVLKACKERIEFIGG